LDVKAWWENKIIPFIDLIGVVPVTAEQDAFVG
jgi:hypothetical protein